MHESESEVAQSSVHGIFQARVLEWSTIAFSSPPPRRSSNFPDLSVEWLSGCDISKVLIDMGHLIFTSFPRDFSRDLKKT